MSTQHPSDFIGSLVEMAKAYEELPTVKANLEQVRDESDRHLATIQRLELKLIDRANQIEALNTVVRSLEVERDDAQFHSLEADDRTARALDFIKATFGNAGSLIQALEPAKAVEPTKFDDGGPYNEPIAPAEPEGLHTTQPVEPPSAAPWSTYAPDGTVSPDKAEASPATPAPEVVPSHPTVSEPLAETGPDASSSGAQPIENVSQPETTPSSQASADRYSGKRYSEISGNGQWPTKDEWLSNGGSLDNFYA